MSLLLSETDCEQLFELELKEITQNNFRYCMSLETSNIDDWLEKAKANNRHLFFDIEFFHLYDSNIIPFQEIVYSLYYTTPKEGHTRVFQRNRYRYNHCTPSRTHRVQYHIMNELTPKLFLDKKRQPILRSVNKENFKEEYEIRNEIIPRGVISYTFRLDLLKCRK